MNSPQLTPPYQQPSNGKPASQANETTLTPLNEIKIEKLEELKVQDLKVYLKKCSLQVSGSKIALVERLKAFLKNKTGTSNGAMNGTALNNMTSIVNIQQLTPPNTPMALDPHGDQNSDSDDPAKYGNNSGCPFNGTTKTIFVNSPTTISHFQTSIPLNAVNGYTIQPNQFQFQGSPTIVQTNSMSQIGSAKIGSSNGTLTLPVASIQQAPQIHFLGNQILASANANAGQPTINQQLGQPLGATGLTMNHLTAMTPTLVTSQFTPILLYSRNLATTNATSFSPMNESVEETTNNSPVKSSIKSSIRKNILMKQKKQEELRQQLQDQNSKMVAAETIQNCKPEGVFYKNEPAKEQAANFLNNANNQMKNSIENPMDSQMDITSKEEKNEFEMDTNSNVFDLLMQVDELADFMNANKAEEEQQSREAKEEKMDCLGNKPQKDCNGLQLCTKSSQIEQISQIDRVDQLNEINQMDPLELETKANLEFNDYPNILNSYDLSLNDLTPDWLNSGDDQLVCQSAGLVNGQQCSPKDTKTFSTNPPNYSKNEPTKNYPKTMLNESSSSNSFLPNGSTKNDCQVNYFETPCNLMDPVLTNFSIDQNLNFFLEDTSNFKTGNNNYEFDTFTCDKTNFAAY